MVGIYAVHLSDDLRHDLVERAVRRLPADERQRVLRSRRECDRRRSALGALLVRSVLAEHLKRSPGELHVRRTDTGRPYLANPGSWKGDFNLSHSGEWLVLALTDRGRVGVDVQQIRDVDLGVARICFTPEERKALALVPGDELRTLFFRIWTLKEALAKAIGLGLGGRDWTKLGVDTSALKEGRFAFRDCAGEPVHGWHCREQSLDASHRMAICASEQPFPRGIRLLDPGELLTEPVLRGSR